MNISMRGIFVNHSQDWDTPAISMRRKNLKMPCIESFIWILNDDLELYYVYLRLVEAQIWASQRSKGFEWGTNKYKGAGGLRDLCPLPLHIGHHILRVQMHQTTSLWSETTVCQPCSKPDATQGPILPRMAINFLRRWNTIWCEDDRVQQNGYQYPSSMTYSLTRSW